MNDTAAPPIDTEPPFGTPPPQTPPQGSRRSGQPVSPWLVIGLVLAVLIMVQSAAWIFAVIGRNHDTVTEQVAALPNLVVNLGAGDVRVGADAASTSDPVITLEAERTWSLSRPKLVWTRSGDTLELTVSCRFTLVGWCTANLDLRVPPGTALEVKSDSGDVEATGLQHAVRLATDSGRLSVRNVLGDATLQTDSGDVAVSGVTGGLELDTDSGDVDVVGSAAPSVLARTDSGSINLELTVDPARIDASTDSGSIEIRVPDTEGVAYLVSMSTDSGNTSGRVRTDPASPRTITAQTDSGNVDIAYR